MRSPLAYPLNRSADMDVGGAADLQTDVMRFMAIISLCLVAIFALVQAMPMTPPTAIQPVVEAEAPAPDTESAPSPISDPAPEPMARSVEASPRPKELPVQKHVVLTRPKWVSQPAPVDPVVDAAVDMPLEAPKVETMVEKMPADTVPADPPPPVVEEPKGFTLRFASDAALTRLVAGSQVGLYALDAQRAKRMSVSESRISFWEASTPSSFHEMERATVPDAVISALARTGVNAETVSWGVILPGKLKGQLDGLMQAHRGGSLVIEANGNILWEASQ